MAYVSMIGPCYVCAELFQFNPMAVPSVPVAGQRRPICAACVAALNPARIARGLPPIVPAPTAYGSVEERDLILPEDES